MENDRRYITNASEIYSEEKVGLRSDLDHI
jgi:hypothetical protein